MSWGYGETKIFCLVMSLKRVLFMELLNSEEMLSMFFAILIMITSNSLRERVKTNPPF